MPKAFDIPALSRTDYEWRLPNDDTPMRTFADILLIGVERMTPNTDTGLLSLYLEMKKTKPYISNGPTDRSASDSSSIEESRQGDVQVA